MSDNQLVVIEKNNVPALFTEDGKLDEIIRQVEMEVATFEHDLSNQARRNKTKSLAYKVAQTKSYLDGLGKDLVSDWKSKAKIVDASRKSMRDRLDELRDLARKPLTEWEAEQAEIKAKQEAEEEAKRLAIELERDHELALMMNDRFDADKEAARVEAERLAAEQKAEEQRLEAERIKKIKEEAAAKARAEAEQAIKDKEAAIKREAEAKEEQRVQSIRNMYPSSRIAGFSGLKPSDYQAEIERLKFVNIGPEFQEFADEALVLLNKLIETLCSDYKKAVELEKKIAEEQRIAAEEEARRIAKAKADAEEKARAERESDQKHRGAINNAAMKDLINAGLDEADAVLVIKLIAKNKISNVTINY